MRGWQVHAAGDASRSAVAVAAAAGVLRRLQRVDRADRAIANCAQHVILAHHQIAHLAHGEVARLTWPRGTGLDRTALVLPLLPAAVQHRRIVVAELMQQPPQPRRPPDVGAAVGHHARSVVHAEPTHRGREVVRRLAHEAECLRGVGHIAQHVDELRAGDMARLEVLTTRLHLIGDLRIGDQVRGAVEHQHVRVVRDSARATRSRPDTRDE